MANKNIGTMVSATKEIDLTTFSLRKGNGPGGEYISTFVKSVEDGKSEYEEYLSIINSSRHFIKTSTYINGLIQVVNFKIPDVLGANNGEPIHCLAAVWGCAHSVNDSRKKNELRFHISILDCTDKSAPVQQEPCVLLKSKRFDPMKVYNDYKQNTDNSIRTDWSDMLEEF